MLVYFMQWNKHSNLPFEATLIPKSNFLCKRATLNHEGKQKFKVELFSCAYSTKQFLMWIFCFGSCREPNIQGWLLKQYLIQKAISFVNMLLWSRNSKLRFAAVLIQQNDSWFKYSAKDHAGNQAFKVDFWSNNYSKEQFFMKTCYFRSCGEAEIQRWALQLYLLNNTILNVNVLLYVRQGSKHLNLTFESYSRIQFLISNPCFRLCKKANFQIWEFWSYIYSKMQFLIWTFCFRSCRKSSKQTGLLKVYPSHQLFINYLGTC